MMTRQACWVDSGGTPHLTKEACQVAELRKLLDLPAEVGETIVENGKEVVSILTLTEGSRPRARGVRKPRKKKDETPSLLPEAPTPETP